MLVPWPPRGHGPVEAFSLIAHQWVTARATMGEGGRAIGESARRT